MTTPAPVRPEDRLVSLDLARGLAVLGILAVNAAAFSMPFEAYMAPELGPFPMEGASAQAWWAVATFFEQKFVTLFSMLFGVSIFLVGGERRDVDKSPVLRRRLFWLLAIGILHGAVIWYGDILTLYALMGFLMLLMRSWKPRGLLILGVVLVFLNMVLESAQASVALAPPEQFDDIRAQMGLPTQEEILAAIERNREGFQASLMQNLQNWGMLAVIQLIGYGAKTLGLMMIGLALFKLGFLKGRAPAWVYVLFVAIGAGALYVIGTETAKILAIDFAFPQSYVHKLANVWLAPLATLGYVSVLMLALKVGLKGLLFPLTAAGRMAFTNYLTQSLIMTAIFYGGRGLELYGQLDRPEVMQIVAGVWLAQLIWSPLWLSVFSMGPLEWIWRCLSYGRMVPITKAGAARVAAA